jgi:hypothetical protein
MSPRKPKGGPQPTGTAPLKIAAAPASQLDSQPSPIPIVREKPGNRQAVLRRGMNRRDPATARVTLIVPGYRRIRWIYLATCPVCLEPHICKAKELATVTRVRKLPCGHYVAVVVARTLGTYGAAA